MKSKIKNRIFQGIFNSIILLSILFATTNPKGIFAAQPDPEPPSSWNQYSNANSEQDHESILPTLNSLEFEKARVKSSMEVALLKYLSDLGPRYQLEIIEIDMNQGWALGMAQWKGNPKTFNGPLNILARHQPDGSWMTIFPDNSDDFSKMVYAAPDTIVSATKKREMITQSNEITNYVKPANLNQIWVIEPRTASTDIVQQSQSQQLDSSELIPTPTPVYDQEKKFFSQTLPSPLTEIKPTPATTLHSYVNNSTATTADAEQGDGISPFLINSLKWTYMGDQTRTITLNYQNQELIGGEYQSNIVLDKPSAEITNFYSIENLKEKGWLYYSDHELPLGVSTLYFQTPNKLLLIEFSGHKDEMASQKENIPTGDGYSVIVWLFTSNTDIAFLTPLPTEKFQYGITDQSFFTLAFANPLQVPIFSQRDPTWKNDRQGWPANACTNSTLGQYGCWTTSYSMIYNYYQPNYTNPRDLNEKLNTGPNNGPKYGTVKDDPCYAYMPLGSPYAPIGVSRGARITNSSTVKNTIDPEDVSFVDSELNAGRPMTAYVHYSGTQPQHMVVITGKGNNTYYINDPWDTSRQYTLADGALGSGGYIVDYIYPWSGNPPSSSGSCSVPNLSSPSNGFTSLGNTITFTWSHPNNCSGQNGFLVRVGTSPGGSDVKSDVFVPGLQGNIDFSSTWNNRDLYWSVRANTSGASWSESRKFRIEPPPPPCNPTSSQIALFIDPDYYGKCVIKGIGDFANPSAIGLPNDSISSIKVGSDVKAVLCKHDNFLECETFLGNDSNLSDNTVGDNSTSSAKVQSRVQIPSSPSLISPNDGTVFTEGNNITLSWTSTGGNYFGEIWGGTSQINFGPQTSTSKDITSQIKAGYLYSWHIKAQNDAGTSSWSSSRSFTVKPKPPTSLSAQVVNCNQINLTWNDNSGNEEGYKIYRNSSYITTVGAGVTNFSDSGLNGSTSYTYYVKAYRGSIESDSSNIINPSTTSCVTIPSAPTLINPSGSSWFVEGENVLFSWSATGTTYTGEIIGGPTIISFGPQTSTSKNLIPQYAGYNYSWHIKAHNSAGSSDWSASRSFNVRPATPTNLIGQSPSCDKINLSWNDNSSFEDKYKIYRDGFYFDTIGPNVTTYTNSNLPDNTTYVYTVQAFRGSIPSYESNSVSVTTQSCAPADTEPPIINWLSPVGDEEVYDVSNEIVQLEVDATDNVGVYGVSYYRWDAVNEEIKIIDFVMTSPFTTNLDCGELNLGWNQIMARAYDDAENQSQIKYIWLYKNPPKPDLAPISLISGSEPVIPSSLLGTNEVGTLFANQPTYFDWYFANLGYETALETFHVALLIDGIQYINYPYDNFGPGQIGGFDDWAEMIPTPGWHTVTLIVDPENVIDESDESNNVWEGSFYWSPSAPFFDDMESSFYDWTATGLWHKVDASSSYQKSVSGVNSWWYGQESNGTYDTGESNSGTLTSPLIYIPPDENYFLRFNYWYQTETKLSAWDQRWLQISIDGQPFFNIFQLYEDNMNTWHNSPVINLSGLSGRTIQIRFLFDSIDSVENSFSGWYIDDFSISTQVPPVCTDAYEPNGDTGNAKPISIGEKLTGYICSNGDSDYFSFSAQAGDSVVIDIDAVEIGSNLDSYIALLDSNGNILSINDDDGMTYDSKLGYLIEETGTYYVRIRDYNHPSVGGNDYFYDLKLYKDTDLPISAQITNPTSSVWLDPYTQTINVTADDVTSGINRVEFLWHSGDWVNSEWIWVGSDYYGADGWSYDLNTADIQDFYDGAIYIWAFDFVGNYLGAGIWGLGLDRTPPLTSLVVYPLYGDAEFQNFYIYWGGEDNLSSIKGYDIQVKDGENGTWTDLLTDTQETMTEYVGQIGHTYYFQSRAYDEALNLGAYSGGLGQASYTVNICEIPPDNYEDDNSYLQANPISINNEAQTHNFHGYNDLDWVKFAVQKDKTYLISTSNIGSKGDTVLNLYNTDGISSIASNDDFDGLELGSMIIWTPEIDGEFYASINHWNSYGFGCSTVYSISIEDITDGMPVLLNISPKLVVAGSGEFELLIVGANFNSNSIGQWDNIDLATTLIDENHLLAIIPYHLLLSGGNYEISVRDGENQRVSNILFFTISADKLIFLPLIIR
jgi:hypothetical protein